MRTHYRLTGPNLTDVAKRLKPEEILESMITPSAKIAEKYAATLLVTTSGKIVEGRIQSETDDVIVLRGQESFAEVKIIHKADIEERLLSKVSMMPKGSVNHLERDEVLDLLAYVLTGKVEEEPAASE